MPKRSLKNKTVEVILLEDHKKLWEKYEVVRVAPIYARNVLIPKWIAVLATKDNLHKYQVKMQKAKEKIANKVKSLEELFMKLSQDWGVVITKKMNEKWTLYDKVWADDILKAIEAKYSISLDSHCLKLKKKITIVWEHKVSYQYKTLDKTIPVVVKWELADWTTNEETKNEEVKSDSKNEEVVESKTE